MSTVFHRLMEAFAVKTKSGYATPQAALVYETPSIPLCEVMKLYERDPTCKSSVDLLAASAVGSGFYTTVADGYEKASEAKSTIDNFNETVNLDALLCDMARMLIACGNDFWLKLTPQTSKRYIGYQLTQSSAFSRATLKKKSLKSHTKSKATNCAKPTAEKT